MRLTPTRERSSQIILRIMGWNNAEGDVASMRTVGPIDGERLNAKGHLGLPDLVQDPDQGPPDHEAESPPDELVVEKEAETMIDAADLREKQKQQQMSTLLKQRKEKGQK